jgi:uncharacterized protein YdiU (UPF0061 family)
MIDTKNNFWKDYPELTFAPELDKFYKEDKSKNKEKSSKIMWGIHLCESLESMFYHNPDKYEQVAEKFIKEEGFKWEAHQKLIEMYREYCLTDAERALTIWNETMRLRNNSLKEMYQNAFEDKDTDELVKLDKMLAATPKMFDDYKKIKADYEEEKTHKTGKRIRSLSDDDVI